MIMLFMCQMYQWRLQPQLKYINQLLLLQLWKLRVQTLQQQVIYGKNCPIHTFNGYAFGSTPTVADAGAFAELLIASRIVQLGSRITRHNMENKSIPPMLRLPTLMLIPNSPGPQYRSTLQSTPQLHGVAHKTRTYSHQQLQQPLALL